jgi:hypothetical protein
MTTDREKQSKKMGEVIKKAWDDEAFMARLLDDTMAVLAEEGVTLPAGMKVKVVANTDQLSYLVIPTKPSREISDAELDIAGGTGATGCGFSRTPDPRYFPQ